MKQQEKQAGVMVFYSYAHEDESLREQLEKHLSMLSRQELISEWHDRQIAPGTEWAKEIDTHLETASVILLLVSPDFLASDYCYGIEMQRALERHTRGEAHVIPIILRPCEWYEAPFARLKILPHDGKPVTLWGDRDEVFHDITQEIRKAIERQIPSARPLFPFSPVDQQNRQHLLKKVRRTWIEGVLEQSLHQAALIALDLQEEPDALDNPWREVQETNLPPRPLPAGTSIVEVYDEADGELLILGAPGVGKTTLLLELTRGLLDRAEGDDMYLTPVVFNLSSWTKKGGSLTQWLIGELESKYGIPREVSQSWVKNDQLLPLLDGLDEVRVDVRSACIDAINAYHLEHRFTPLVVCSRRTGYFSQEQRVSLQRAIVIQPLTEGQVDTYLLQRGEQAKALHAALHADSVLLELAKTPLMLSILTLAYQGEEHVQELLREDSLEVRRKLIFTKYVQKMFERRSPPLRSYTREKTKRWLVWLAQQMVQRNLNVFYLEQMQSDWLPNNWSRVLCRALVGLVNWIAFLPALILFLGLNPFLLNYWLLFLGVSVLGWVFYTSPSWETTERVWLETQQELRNGKPPIPAIQYLWHRERPMVIASMIFSLIISLGGGLLILRTTGIHNALILWGVSVLFLGALAVMSGGGLRWAHHRALRLVLWCSGSIPLNYRHFLDYAAERIFFYKVDVGYIFIHRSLLEYFALSNRLTSGQKEIARTMSRD